MNDGWKDRIPPHNIEAEQAVIGAIFLEPEAFSTASELLVPEDFYRAAHQRIFETMMRLSDRAEAIDVITATSDLNDRKQLEEAGGASYLTEVAGRVPTAANIMYYSGIVEEQPLIRPQLRT